MPDAMFAVMPVRRVMDMMPAREFEFDVPLFEALFQGQTRRTRPHLHADDMRSDVTLELKVATATEGGVDGLACADDTAGETQPDVRPSANGENAVAQLDVEAEECRDQFGCKPEGHGQHNHCQAGRRS